METTDLAEIKADTSATIRILIDGQWNTEEFRRLFTTLSRLYTFCSIDEHWGCQAPFDSPFECLMEDIRLKAALKTNTLADGLALLRKILDIATEEDMQRALVKSAEQDGPDDENIWKLARLEHFLASYLASTQIERVLRELDAFHHLPFHDNLSGWHRKSRIGIPANVSYLDEWISFANPLLVSRIQFGSPGFTDISGVGTVIGHLKELLLGLLKAYQARRAIYAEGTIKLAEARMAEAEAKFVEEAYGYARQHLRRFKALEIDEAARLSIESEVASEIATVLTAIHDRRFVGVSNPAKPSDDGASG